VSQTFPNIRMRRLRKTPQLRDMLTETHLTANDLIYPIFVEEDIDAPIPISLMPGISRIPEKKLGAEIKAIQADGVKAVILFGVSHNKDATGSDSLKAEGLLARMIKRAKDAAPEMIVISDTCFCEYTDHGHCGVVEHSSDHNVHKDHKAYYVHNDQTISNLAKQAVHAANAGVDIVAPSAMMDGQVKAIRQGLDEAGYTDMPVMAYSAKFASSFYGPFRAAAGCDLKGDRKAYQMNPMNPREALRESMLDEAEGADILMVKPGLAYLDILSQLRQQTLLPIAMYQVGGEYAMIKFAAQAGALDEKRVVRETLGAMKRAGADLILSYFARDVVREGF